MSAIFYKSACTTLMRTFCPFQTRGTYILKRRWTPYLSKVEGKMRRLQQKNFVYDLVENTEGFQKKIPLILLEDVEGIGNVGDVVNVRENIAWNDLLLSKKVTYASPENLAKLEEQKAKGLIVEKKYSSVWAPMTIKDLSVFLLTVVMHMENPWILEPWHIRVSFRKAGYVVPDHAITLPSKPISGPDLSIQGKEFPIKVTINKTESVFVRARIHHWTANESKQLPPVEQHWKMKAEPIFPEDAELLNSLPSPEHFTEQLRKKRLRL